MIEGSINIEDKELVAFSFELPDEFNPADIKMFMQGYGVATKAYVGIVDTKVVRPNCVGVFVITIKEFKDNFADCIEDVINKVFEYKREKDKDKHKAPVDRFIDANRR